MQGRPLREDPLELGGVERRDLRRVEPAVRRSSSSGDENAFWTVTCWSSAKPINSASGSRASSSFASLLSVK